MSTKLKPQQRRAAMLLATGQTAASIANQLKIRPETLSRWKRNPLFMKAYQQQVETLRAGLADRILFLVDAAMSELQMQLRTSLDPTKAALSVLKLVGAQTLPALNPPPPVTETTIIIPRMSPAPNLPHP